MTQRQPVFSIIVPTYNRPGQLDACLQSLACLDYPRDRFEAIVVDDGSETPLEGVVSLFRDRLSLTLVRQTHAGPATARNTGAARARGEFLAFTDDDCAPARDWLQALAARFATAPDHAVGGRLLNALGDNPYSATSQVIMDVVYAYYNDKAAPGRFFCTANLALPAGRFHAVGGFDPSFTTSEDRDLCDRWLRHGYRMTYAPEALVYHAHPLTLRTFWRLHFNYGCGTFRFHRARAGRGSRWIRPDPKFYLTFLRGRMLRPRGPHATILAMLLILWQVAYAAGFFWEGMSHVAKRIGRKKGRSHPQRAPVVKGQRQ